MTYAVLQGVITGLGTLVMAGVLKLFFKSYFEDRPNHFWAVCFGVSFAVGMTVSMSMRQRDERLLRESGFSEAQGEWVRKRVKRFLSDPNYNETYEKIKNEGRGDLAIDSREIFWTGAKSGLLKIDFKYVIEFANLAYKLATETNPALCGQLYSRSVSAADLYRAIAQLPEKEFEAAIDLILELFAARDWREPRAVVDPRLVEAGWSELQVATDFSKVSTLKINVDLGRKGLLSDTDACQVLKDLWVPHKAIGFINYNHLLVSTLRE